MRGLAILLVLAHNLSPLEAPTNLIGRALEMGFDDGWIGVQLFFVLSGFLITGILLDTQQASNYFKSFIVRRALRIFPIYYLTLIAFLIVLPAVGVLAHDFGGSWQHQLPLWLYYSNWTLPYGLGGDAMPHFWSLAVEEQFYLLWPLLIYRLKPMQVIKLCVGLAVASLLIRIGMLASQMQVEAIYTFTVCRMDALALGGAAAALLRVPAWRDRLTQARDALTWLVQNPDATTDSGAAAELAAGTALAPALEAQMARARARSSAADDALREAEAAWEAATETYQRRSAAVLTLEAEHERLHLARTSATTEPVSEPLMEAARASLRTLVRRAEDVEGDALRTARERATLEERRARTAEERVRAAAALEVAEKAALEPAEAWERLRAEALAAGLGHRIDARPPAPRDEDAPPEGASSVAHAHEAQASRGLLLDRLRSARGGAELADELEETRELAKTYAASVEWLMRRLPAFVAEGRDPAARLDELRAHLVRLEERLAYQERDLRGSSADIAATIEVRVRKASTQIRRLNQLLSGVAFGNISGIRVQSKRVERMEQVLRALREGKGQDLLFSGRLPLEEAMNELFKRYGGGRTGGVRLLDYREYMDLSVEIQRQGETKSWEVAAATRLSTGEAIGVGAALMMVVLSEWERDTALLRSRRAFGSLRFLFLDEANRLSRDNLAVLFSLCESLDLQLLIAAPEVATATGNTTYRLVRVVHDDGSEEVIVSGRRALPDLPIALPGPEGAIEEQPATDVEG